MTASSAVVDIDAFRADGFVRVENVVPREVADAARTLLWEQLPWSPDDPSSWTEPVRWVADLTGAGPFGRLARSPRLAAALDAVCGFGGWRPRGSLGNIPVRFPVGPPAEDRGWHIDTNATLPDGSWTVSGRPHTVLLLLTLLSEVGPDDVYVVHPFTVHAADVHRGREPRFMAQAPVQLTSPLTPATGTPLGCVFAD